MPDNRSNTLSILSSDFEFNERLLVTLIDECYSCRFGTFLFDYEKERVDAKVKENTVCLIPFFRQYYIFLICIHEFRALIPLFHLVLSMVIYQFKLERISESSVQTVRVCAADQWRNEEDAAMGELLPTPNKS